MKKFYIKSLLAFIVFLLSGISTTTAQETWSYDWPKGATSDKGASGFYNYPRDYELTSQTKTLNNKEWTINFKDEDKGTYFTYLSTSKQAVGNSSGVPEEFTLTSKDFEGVIKHVKVKARHSHKDASVAVNVGGTDMVLSGGGVI